MKRYKRVYALYKRDEYVKEGTVEELAEASGLTPKYIYWLAHTSTPIKKWTIVATDEKVELFAPIEDVDWQRIKELKQKNGYTDTELGEIINKSSATVSLKINGHVRFSYEEIEDLEDLFFLEPGELLKERRTA